MSGGPLLSGLLEKEQAMSDKREDSTPQPDEKPHKVDEKTQEDAAKERSENEGYD